MYRSPRWITTRGWVPLLMALVTACGPAASTSPSPAPTSAPAAPAKSAPAAPASGAPQTQDWTADWQQTVEAAKKEKLVIVSMPGENDKKIMAMFQEAYPGIEVEHTGARPSDISPKIISEQQNGVYAWDVFESTGASNMHEVLLPAGAFQDLPQFIVDPSVMDDSKWRNGKWATYSSSTKPQILSHDFSLRNGLYINRDVIPRDELKSLDDLMNPKYQGKMVVDDCTVAAQGTSTIIGLWQAKGPDWVRKLFTEQKPVFQETVRVTSEWVATGRYPIAIGPADQELVRLQNEGIGKNVEPLEYGGGNVSASGVAIFKNAPHPNAAKVFVNWFLSQDGQMAWTKAHNNPPARNSRRSDVPLNDPKGVPDYSNLGQYFIWGTETGS
ncbi:MAG: ABC transporter substrate-binding protein, partial [Chloroflexota bacterium]